VSFPSQQTQVMINVVDHQITCFSRWTKGLMKIIAANTPRIAARSGATEGCIVFISAAVYPGGPSDGPLWGPATARSKCPLPRHRTAGIGRLRGRLRVELSRGLPGVTNANPTVRLEQDLGRQAAKCDLAVTGEGRASEPPVGACGKLCRTFKFLPFRPIQPTMNDSRYQRSPTAKRTAASIKRWRAVTRRGKSPPTCVVLKAPRTLYDR
jgi:hypothetical protein